MDFPDVFRQGGHPEPHTKGKGIDGEVAHKGFTAVEDNRDRTRRMAGSGLDLSRNAESLEWNRLFDDDIRLDRLKPAER